MPDNAAPATPASPFDARVAYEDHRPRYSLTDDQENQLEAFKLAVFCMRAYLTEHPPPCEVTPQYTLLTDQLTAACTGWMFGLVDHQLPANQTESALVSASLAMGIVPKTGKWILPKHYTPKLSALVTTSKLIVLYKAYLDPTSCSANTPKDGKVPLYQLVRQLADRALRPTSENGYPHPVNWFIGLRNYGRACANRQPEDAIISWVANDTMLFQKSQMSIYRF